MAGTGMADLSTLTRDELKEELSSVVKGAFRSELQEQLNCFFQEVLSKELKQIAGTGNGTRSDLQESLQEALRRELPTQLRTFSQDALRRELTDQMDVLTSTLLKELPMNSARPHKPPGGSKSGSPFSSEAGATAPVVPDRKAAPSNSLPTMVQRGTSELPGLVLGSSSSSSKVQPELPGSMNQGKASADPATNSKSNDHIRRMSRVSDHPEFENMESEGPDGIKPEPDGIKPKHVWTPEEGGLLNANKALQKTCTKNLSKAPNIDGVLPVADVAVEEEVHFNLTSSMATLVEDRYHFLTKHAQRLVQNSRFDFFFGGVIMSNAISMGIQTEFMAQSSSELVPTEMQLFDTVFCLLFLFELITRLTAHGLVFFWMTGWQWNWFDCILVSMQVFEEIVVLIARKDDSDGSDNDSDTAGGNFSFLRVLRVLRLVRLVRLARVLRFVRQLRTLVCSIGVSLQSLGWTVMLIMLMIYVVGIYVTQMVSTHKRTLSAEEQERPTFKSLDFYFGNLGRSILTLFEAISSGVDWDELAHPLSEEISSFTAMLFSSYIAFAVLAMMNVVTGVFVESALQGSAQDKESQIVGTLEDLFTKFDVDQSGTIAENEFDDMINSPSVMMQFKALDVNMHQAKSLFRLIDVDRIGVIDTDAFIMGCLRLRGTARAADMTTLIYELKRFMSKWQSHALFLETELAKIKESGAADALSRNRSTELVVQTQLSRHSILGNQLGYGPQTSGGTGRGTDATSELEDLFEQTRA